MPSLDFKPRCFAPAEIEKIADVSTGLQREWRRQNILPKNETGGWTRAPLKEVTKIAITKMMADLGVPLKKARDTADQVVNGVLAELVSRPGAVKINFPPMSEAKRDKIASDVWQRIICELAPGDKDLILDALPKSGWDNAVASNVWKTALDSARYWTLGSRQDVAGHIIPVKSLESLPANLAAVTLFDNRRAADIIFRRVDLPLVEVDIVEANTGGRSS
jgi:hypothetical protein